MDKKHKPKQRYVRIYFETNIYPSFRLGGLGPREKTTNIKLKQRYQICGLLDARRFTRGTKLSAGSDGLHLNEIGMEVLIQQMKMAISYVV